MGIIAEVIAVVNTSKNLSKLEKFVPKVLGDRTIRKEVGNYVPAPAVIRRPRALSGFIGRKERVGGFVRLLLNPTA